MQTFNLRQFSVVTALAAAAFTMVGTGVAHAGEVSYAGSATGKFLTTNTTDLFGGSAAGGLSYTGSTFSDTTSGGFSGIGNVAGTPNFNNLGSFTLANNGTYTYSGEKFELTVTFTSPIIIQGSNTATNTATLVGKVTQANGGIQFNFTSAPTVFTYANALESGTFTFYVNNAAVSAGGTSAVTGYIDAASSSPVPELSTVTGMGSLLAGGGLTMFGGVIRRRRKNGTLAA